MGRNLSENPHTKVHNNNNNAIYREHIQIFFKCS